MCLTSQQSRDVQYRLMNGAVVSLVVLLIELCVVNCRLNLLPIEPVTQDIANGLAILIEIQLDLNLILSSAEDTIHTVTQRIHSVMNHAHIAKTYEVEITKHSRFSDKQDSLGRQWISMHVLVQDSSHRHRYDVKIVAYYKTYGWKCSSKPDSDSNKNCSLMIPGLHARLKVPMVTLDEIKGYATVDDGQISEKI